MKKNSASPLLRITSPLKGGNPRDLEASLLQGFPGSFLVPMLSSLPLHSRSSSVARRWRTQFSEGLLAFSLSRLRAGCRRRRRRRHRSCRRRHRRRCRRRVGPSKGERERERKVKRKRDGGRAREAEEV